MDFGPVRQLLSYCLLKSMFKFSFIIWQVVGILSQSHMSEMFAFHATTMANTLNTPIIVFTRTGSMAILLSHYQPSSTIFAFTNEWVQLQFHVEYSFKSHVLISYVIITCIKALILVEITVLAESICLFGYFGMIDKLTSVHLSCWYSIMLVVWLSQAHLYTQSGGRPGCFLFQGRLFHCEDMHVSWKNYLSGLDQLFYASMEKLYTLY